VGSGAKKNLGRGGANGLKINIYFSYLNLFFYLIGGPKILLGKTNGL
jgi:hypothetical protein